MQDLEFTISQYLDGTLSPADRTALERHLESDADARTMLDEYRRLNVAMKAMPLPAFQWDALSRSISAAVDAAHERRSRNPIACRPGFAWRSCRWRWPLRS